MKMAFVGDIHGLLDLAYSKVSKYSPDVVILMGDTELSPNIESVRKSKFARFGEELKAGEKFDDYLVGKSKIPYPTFNVRGNHEDFGYLDAIASGKEFLPQGMVYLRDGFNQLSNLNGGFINVGVVGGSYSWNAFNAKTKKPKFEHCFNKSDVDRLKERNLDLLLSHYAPKSGKLSSIGGLGSKELTELIKATQPRLAIHGHHDLAYETKIGETRIIGLRDIHQPDSIFVYDTETGKELKVA